MTRIVYHTLDTCLGKLARQEDADLLCVFSLFMNCACLPSSVDGLLRLLCNTVSNSVAEPNYWLNDERRPVQLPDVAQDHRLTWGGFFHPTISTEWYWLQQLAVSSNATVTESSMPDLPQCAISSVNFCKTLYVCVCQSLFQRAV